LKNFFIKTKFHTPNKLFDLDDRTDKFDFSGKWKFSTFENEYEMEIQNEDSNKFSAKGDVQPQGKIKEHLDFTIEGEAFENVGSMKMYWRKHDQEEVVSTMFVSVIGNQNQTRFDGFWSSNEGDGWKEGVSGTEQGSYFGIRL
jgi:hypothetical protein